MGRPDRLRYERALGTRGYVRIAGVDEAGRGPLAGPVVAAAVVLPTGYRDDEIADSKTLSAAKRVRLDERIRAVAWAVAVREESVELIDRMNILRATVRAMREAVLALRPAPDFVVVDHVRIPELPMPQRGWIRADSRVQAVAAASIVAKVHRDRLMDELHDRYPTYGFDRHRGYATEQHRAVLLREGPCPAHRRTFLRTLFERDAQLLLPAFEMVR